MNPDVELPFRVRESRARSNTETPLKGDNLLGRAAPKVAHPWSCWSRMAGGVAVRRLDDRLGNSPYDEPACRS